MYRIQYRLYMLTVKNIGLFWFCFFLGIEPEAIRLVRRYF